MRGGRTEPRLVSRTTYNAHAQARLGPIGSFSDFVQEQRRTDGILSDASGGAPGNNLRGRSPSPDVSPLAGSGRKRLPESPDPNTRPKNRQCLSAEFEHLQHDVMQEDLGEVQQEFGVGSGRMSSLFGSTGDATTRPVDSAEHHVCSVILQLLYCLLLWWRTKYTRIG